jgi:hypothetical protein
MKVLAGSIERQFKMETKTCKTKQNKNMKKQTKKRKQQNKTKQKKKRFNLLNDSIVGIED